MLKFRTRSERPAIPCEQERFQKCKFEWNLQRETRESPLGLRGHSQRGRRELGWARL